MRDLDHIFDVYRNSRAMPGEYFKVSYHLILAPDTFYMMRNEQAYVAGSVSKALLARLTDL